MRGGDGALVSTDDHEVQVGVGFDAGGVQVFASIGPTDIFAGAWLFGDFAEDLYGNAHPSSLRLPWSGCCSSASGANGFQLSDPRMIQGFSPPYDAYRTDVQGTGGSVVVTAVCQ